ncbi:hypothetical protein CO154_02525 [Candidatus Pacearchaeota archaeon CG_4_9_14_3_um_filter_31_7]|nr:MAG: macrolide ABC transporter ATP-binding protein [Candidatus Pacearchaeota archaeon CG1_02_31_27]PIN92430.1 MAG: hypothetical protein COU55_01345 [Candidatus Pacearchaeota archaeon CG10_big_fil_rev_8_21_14_0_10_31_59]PIZ81015.1 MAG: hypothetical protein COX99_01045 [Candidatus Pacearchaeota archaeon CG_4_10_14_0_2_um_filter_31_10]PJA70511.1 MAG: hypothetical protein CO154_02525 [Candidatus Pacearchaeota archaeon CG_4_9_14_3_um_filter_31_7]
MKTKPIIKLHNVCKDYQMGDSVVKALSNIDLEIHKGDFIAITGPSGSGKSTMMNLVGCLDVPTEGHIFLDSYDITMLQESQLAKIRGKKIGFIFQQFNLMQNLNAKENIMMPMMFQNISSKDRDEKAEQLLRAVELTDREKHKPGEMSGGQQQRVAIARALSNNPEVILADEPTGNLDSKTGEIVMEFLKKLNSEGKTIIIVTHDLNIAKQAKRIIKLRDGAIIK